MGGNGTWGDGLEHAGGFTNITQICEARPLYSDCFTDCSKNSGNRARSKRRRPLDWVGAIVDSAL
jgi:hypothetical protein